MDFPGFLYFCQEVFKILNSPLLVVSVSINLMLYIRLKFTKEELKQINDYLTLQSKRQSLGSKLDSKNDSGNESKTKPLYKSSTSDLVYREKV
tara:strand:+ start:3324 stop:3602 length:279 start_codon:yes stop_codon:yes gene_type:complete